MQHLNSSEWVMTKYKNEITFAQITSWLHRLPDKEVNFYRIILKDGSQLKLTAKHYIYKTTCDNLLEQKVDFETIEDEAEWATNVNIGDCLYRVRNVEVEVVAVDWVTEKGIFAPMTGTGDIIVNGIHASCHNILHSHSLQYSFFQAVESVAKWFRWMSGADQAFQKDVPHGLELITEMLDFVLPSSLHTL
ncbi:unnamed protein product [Gongylonema pulchrum]|uniref:Hint domain-containing protein n=1 Tax=Gongylonema pulchrum TaxID=637853 RepID=A0A3P7MQE1_9BILA|nr:unnamed protein product [Gongylonema pulchrum]